MISDEKKYIEKEKKQNINATYLDVTTWGNVQPIGKDIDIGLVECLLRRAWKNGKKTYKMVPIIRIDLKKKLFWFDRLSSNGDYANSQMEVPFREVCVVSNYHSLPENFGYIKKI